MARFPSLCLRLVFASGVVLATAFSLQAPLQARSSAAPAQGKGLAFAPPKAAAPAAGVVPVVGKNDFSFRLQSVSGGAAPAKKEGLLEKVWNEDTKLAAYVGIWYLGNIYCELMLI